MNKYEKALNSLKHISNYGMFDKKKIINDIQELVERTTPKKVIKGLDKHKSYYPSSSYWADCPSCNYTVFNDNETIDKFCPNCGIALDWSE